MSDRIDALALPPRDPYVGRHYGPGYGMPPEEPAVLWRLTQRHWKLLLLCAALSGGVAYLAGKFLAKPLWQAEATLLYQPIALSEKQKAAYEHPPSLPTLAGWVKDPALLRQLIDEFHLGVSEDTLAESNLKVEQPAATESIMVTFRWPDRDKAAPVLTRLLEMFSDYVANNRKESILLRIEKMDQQAAVACEDDINRLNEQVAALEQKLTETGKLSDDDLDGSMLARQGTLKESIRNIGHKVDESKSELRAKRADRETLAPVVEKQAESKIKLKVLDDEIEQLELQIAHNLDSVEAANEELRTLPIVLTKAKRNERTATLKYLKEQLKQYAAARKAIGRPGGPVAAGALEGMDAHEFSIKTPARVGDKPATSNQKTMFALTFLGLMAFTFGLLFVHDRRHPAPEQPMSRPEVVYVTPPPADSHFYGNDIHRLTAHIQQWVNENRGPIVTPPPGQNGNAEVHQSPPAANGHVADPEVDVAAERDNPG